MKRFSIFAALFAVMGWVGVAHAQWSTVFEAGVPGGEWRGNPSGIEFVQETGVNDPPGNPDSPVADAQADDDFYFAGTYPDPIGTVDDEVAFERAFAGIDNNLRIHFNLPADLPADQRFRFTFEPFNLDGNGAEPRYGVEVLFNDTVILPEILVVEADLGNPVTTAEFSTADVGAMAGPGGDNVITLRGINMNAEGGGNWMGINHHHLETAAVPEPACITLLVCGVICLFPKLRRYFVG
jgi:hypothetical protein